MCIRDRAHTGFFPCPDFYLLLQLQLILCFKNTLEPRLWAGSFGRTHSHRRSRRPAGGGHRGGRFYRRERYFLRAGGVPPGLDALAVGSLPTTDTSRLGVLDFAIRICLLYTSGNIPRWKYRKYTIKRCFCHNCF